MARFKHFEPVNRIDKNARYIKIDRKTIMTYISTHFKPKDEGRAFFKLACSAAVRSGYAKYTKFNNFVPEGSWVGGIVGLKAILSDNQNKLSRPEVESIVQQLEDKGYIYVFKNGKKYEVHLSNLCVGDEYTLFVNPCEKTKGRNGGWYHKEPVEAERVAGEYSQLGIIKNYDNAHGEDEYKIEWTGEVETDLSQEEDNRVYNYSNEGWLPLPKSVFDNRAKTYQEKKDKRNRSDANKHRAERFSPCEAFLDLIAHTVYRDFDNFFSWFGACVMIDNDVLLTCRNLAVRWGWGKSEVQRFLKEHSEVFECITMPGNCGTVIYNKMIEVDYIVPSQEDLHKYFKEVVCNGRVFRSYANDYVFNFSFLFIKKYFCRGIFCPKGDAIRRFVALCKKQPIPIADSSNSALFGLEVLHKVGVPGEWASYFGKQPELPEFWLEI